MNGSDFDVAVVGAGAAGLGAAARLQGAGLACVVLEAKDRVGGRAHALPGPSGVGLDLGCGWLHSAERNDWAEMVRPMGFTLDTTAAPWTRPAVGANFPAADQRAYRQAFDALEVRLERAAEAEKDQAASALLLPGDDRWRPLFDAFSGAYNGAPLDQISVKDYAAYQPTDQNWRVREGYGALIAAFARPLDVRLETPVSRIEHAVARLRVTTPGGVLEARAVIVAVPTRVLADEVIVLDPPLPDHLQAAADLPLGHVEKAFLGVKTPDIFPIDSRAVGRTDTADTGNYTLRPLGAPVVEAFYGGDIAAELGREPGALGRFAVEELAALFGSHVRAALTPIAESGWRADPFIRGAYSHARVGRAGARAALARTAGERLFFAGEACSAHAFSTAHGAYEAGVAAAEDVMRVLRPSAGEQGRG